MGATWHRWLFDVSVFLSGHPSVCPLVCLHSHMSLYMFPGTSWGSSVCLSGIQVSVCSYLFIHPMVVCRLTIVCRACQLVIVGLRICFIWSQYAIMSLGFKKVLHCILPSCNNFIITLWEIMVFPLCLVLLLLLPLPHLWQLCDVLLLSLWLFPKPPPWCDYQWHWVSLMWFCHHCWCWLTQEVLLASPLCHSSNFGPRCLLRHMPIMPWVLCR